MESKIIYLIDQMVDVMFLMVLRVEDEDMLLYLIQDGGGGGVGGTVIITSAPGPGLCHSQRFSEIL